MSLDSLVFETHSFNRKPIYLRQATPEDGEFVNALTRKVMAEYVALTWPSVAEQEAYFKKNLFVCQPTKIIHMEGKDIGRLTVIATESTVTIDNIHILPEYHGLGIGNALIEKVIRGARNSERHVELQVLIVNPARRLYERLGFEIHRRDKERLYMRLTADSHEVVS